MPEGHTIHRLARDQRPRFEGRRVRASSPQGRFADGAKLIDGRTVESIDAHGKHLLYRIDRRRGPRTLHVHLGLYGKFRARRVPLGEPVGAVRLRLVAEEHGFDLNGPAACELLDDASVEALRARLGEDPLRADADADRFIERAGRSRKAIGSILLDQSMIAGIGNIYRSEILFLEGIDPERAGRDCSAVELARIWDRAEKLLAIGVRYDRIITADPERVGKPYGRMNRDERLLLYKKDRCPACGGAVRAFELANRSAFACPACQH